MLGFCNFLFAPHDPKLQALIEEQRPHLRYNDYCLLTGPPKSGRTSLLFQYAYRSSMETRRVLFITSQRKSYAHPPMFPKGVTPDSDVLHRIRMKYCDNHGALLTYLAHFHLMESFPEVIVVDDFSEFFSSLGPDKSDAMAHALALLRDAADFVSSVLYDSDACSLANTRQSTRRKGE